MGLRAQPFREDCSQQELVQIPRVTAQSYETDPHSRLGYPTLLQISISHKPLLQLNNL